MSRYNPFAFRTRPATLEDHLNYYADSDKYVVNEKLFC